MDFNYKHIISENRQFTNRFISLWLLLLSGVCFTAWILALTHVIDVSTSFFYIAAPISSLLFIMPSFLCFLLKLSNSFSLEDDTILFLSYWSIGCVILATLLISCCFPFYCTIAWLFPLAVACQYDSKKITLETFFLGLTGLLLSFILAIPLGSLGSLTIFETTRLSLSTLGKLSFVMLPCIILYCLALPVFYNITKRSSLLLKKQKLSILATQTKQSIHMMQEFPDTFTTDCKIKMRYLAKHNIDVDGALKALDDNVEQYNEHILTFINESIRREEELYSLLDSDTLLQYGAKVHALRVKANRLGLKNLTDTAFFHEMESYAGNLEIVEANWNKLACEWEEAYELFHHYVQSLGLKNHACDSQGNQISFQEWGAQLDEAFLALESSDTLKARDIFNDLLKYQIDSDINKSLELILRNIDDILKA